jgi:hypothetical protein
MVMNSAQTRRYRRAFRTLEHYVLIDAEKHRAAGAWCLAQFGKRWEAIDHPDGFWAMFWAGRDDHDRYIFHFAEDKDAMLFSLKWV